MKRYIAWISAVAIAFMLAGCNLFIDDNDTVDDYGFKNVPQHSGEGYDEPVTVQDGEATITYQFKKNVRVLTPEVQQWIVKSEMDPTGTGYIISFRGDTPEDLLPVQGEILVSKVTDKFEWGLNHLVVCSYTDNGVITYGAVISNIEDTYEQLQMDGRVTTIEKETYYTYDIDDSVVDLDENGIPIVSDENNSNEVSSQARQDTRGDKDPIDGTKGYVEYDDDRFIINLPVDKEFELDMPKGFKAKVDTKGSTMTVDTKIDLAGFDLAKGKYNVKLTQTVDEDFKIKLSGGWSGNKRIKRFKPVKGKTIVLSYVVLVLFVNIDIEIEGSVEATFALTKSFHQTKTYDINLKDKTMQVHEDKEATGDGETKLDSSDKNGQIKIDHVIIEGKFGVFAKVHLGIGFYGKIISLRVVPKIGAELSIVMAAYWDSDSETIYDIGDETGITVSFPFSVDLGIYWEIDLDIDLDFNAKEFFLDVTSNALPAPLRFAMRFVTSKGIDFWTSLIEGNEDDYDATKAHDAGTVEDENGEKIALSDGFFHTFGPWYPIESIHFAWFPTMKKNSFKILKSWDEEKEQLNFTGEFQCAGIGFIGGLGIHFVPALQIYEGSDLKQVIYPEEGGKNAVLHAGDTYHFKIDQSSEDVTYYARPCYYSKPLVRQNPDALDKSLPFCAYTPMISITDMKPTYANADAYDTQGRFIYTFLFDLYTSVKGITNVGSFGIEDVLYEGKFNHTYKPRSDKQLSDGTYIMKYEAQVHSNYTSKDLKMNLRPWLTIPNITSRFGEEYGFIISTNGWYRSWNAQKNEKGKKKTFTAHARQGFWDDEEVDENQNDDDEVKVVLKAIESANGEVIWENTPRLPLNAI